MLDRVLWEKIVDDDKKGGLIQYWIAQMDSTYVKKNYPKGVCHALTFDWIKSKRGYSADTRRFESQFSSKRDVEDTVPHEYVDMQKNYSKDLALAQIQLGTLTQLALASNLALDEAGKRLEAEATDANRAAFQLAARKRYEDLLNQQNYARIAQGGPDCLDHRGFDSLEAALTYIESQNPSLWALTMIRKSADQSALGHVFGFYSSSEFFDSNFALAWFPASQELKDFVLGKLWPHFYVEQGVAKYDVFTLYRYDLGFKGEADDSNEKKQQPTMAELQQLFDEMKREAKPKKNKLCVIM